MTLDFILEHWDLIQKYWEIRFMLKKNHLAGSVGAGWLTRRTRRWLLTLCQTRFYQGLSQSQHNEDGKALGPECGIACHRSVRETRTATYLCSVASMTAVLYERKMNSVWGLRSGKITGLVSQKEEIWSKLEWAGGGDSCWQYCALYFLFPLHGQPFFPFNNFQTFRIF